MKDALKNVIFAAAAFAVSIAAWAVAAAAAGSDLILPAPKEALGELLRCLRAAWFWRAAWYTTLRSILGFALSFAAGTTLAALSCRFTAVRRFVSPLMSVLAAVPTMSVILLLIVWFGADATPVFVALLVIMPVLYTGLTTAVDQIDISLVENARIYSVSGAYKLRKVYAPLVAPAYLDTCARAVSINFKLVVAAEVLSATRDSLGRLMQQAQTYFDTARLLAVTVGAIAVALLLEFAVRLIRRRFVY